MLNMCSNCRNNQTSKSQNLELVPLNMDATIPLTGCEVCEAIKNFHIFTNLSCGGPSSILLNREVQVCPSLPNAKPIRQ